MVKKIRFQEIRARRRGGRIRDAFVFEPRDAALVGAATAAVALVHLLYLA